MKRPKKKKNPWKEKKREVKIGKNYKNLKIESENSRNLRKKFS